MFQNIKKNNNKILNRELKQFNSIVVNLKIHQNKPEVLLLQVLYIT